MLYLLQYGRKSGCGSSKRNIKIHMQLYIEIIDFIFAFIEYTIHVLNYIVKHLFYSI